MRHSERWEVSLSEVHQFQQETGNLPAEKADSEPERRLAWWLRYQRRKLAAGTLDDEKVEKLSVLGPWEEPNRRRLAEPRWQASLAEVLEFINSNGWHPSRSADRDSDEYRMAIWLNTQRRRHMAGRLSGLRVAALDEQIPGWRTRKPDAERLCPICRTGYVRPNRQTCSPACARLRTAELTRAESLHNWHNEWVQLYHDGMNFARIGHLYGVSRTTVGKTVRCRLESHEGSESDGS